MRRIQTAARPIAKAKNAATMAAEGRADNVLTWRLIASRVFVRWIAPRIVLARNAATMVVAVFAVNVPRASRVRRVRASACLLVRAKNAATMVAVDNAERAPRWRHIAWTGFAP